MVTVRHRLRTHAMRGGAALVVAVLAALAMGGTGSAGLLGGLLSPCPGPYTHPFQQWGDGASYRLAPNGGLESGESGWRLSNGAAVIPGNEPFRLAGDEDASSLSLPAGSSATTPDACIGTLSPTMRFVARNGGSADSTLRVDVSYRDLLGIRWTITAANVRVGPDWQPADRVLVLANITALPLLQGGTTDVRFRFTPQGDGDWQLDDVFVDPYVGT